MVQNLLQRVWMLRNGDRCIGTWMDVLEQSKHLFTLSCFMPSRLRWISHSDEVVVRVDFLETRISSGRIDYKSSIIFQLSFIGVKMLENCHFVLDDSNNYSLFNTFVLSTGLGNVIVAINIYIIRCVG